MSVVGGLESQRQGGHGDREDAVRNVVGVLKPADVPQVLQNIVHAGPRIGVRSTPPDQPTRPLEGHGVSIGSLGHGRGVQPPKKNLSPRPSVVLLRVTTYTKLYFTTIAAFLVVLPRVTTYTKLYFTTIAAFFSAR